MYCWCSIAENQFYIIRFACTLYPANWIMPVSVGAQRVAGAWWSMTQSDYWNNSYNWILEHRNGDIWCHLIDHFNLIGNKPTETHCNNRKYEICLLNQLFQVQLDWFRMPYDLSYIICSIGALHANYSFNKSQSFFFLIFIHIQTRWS